MAKHNRECSIGDNNRHGTFSIFLLQGNHDNNYKVTGITGTKHNGKRLSYVMKTRPARHTNRMGYADLSIEEFMEKTGIALQHRENSLWKRRNG